jgi:hypothetical protein
MCWPSRRGSLYRLPEPLALGIRIALATTMQPWAVRAAPGSSWRSMVEAV